MNVILEELQRKPWIAVWFLMVAFLALAMVAVGLRYDYHNTVNHAARHAVERLDQSHAEIMDKQKEILRTITNLGRDLNETKSGLAVEVKRNNAIEDQVKKVEEQ